MFLIPVLFIAGDKVNVKPIPGLGPAGSSVVTASACGLKALGFSSSQGHAGSIPGAGQGSCGREPVDVSHINVSIPPPYFF